LNLIELKLYLRGEHLQARSVQTRLKRIESFHASQVDEDLSNQTTSPNAATTTASVAGPAPAADASTAQDVSTPCDDSVVNSIRQPSMRRIAQELIEAVETDNKEPLPEPSPDALSIPIKDLFNFTQSYWVEAYDKLATRGLQDELELYELLDLDADGDTIENEADDALNE
jgi:hypothetical protein